MRPLPSPPAPSAAVSAFVVLALIAHRANGDGEGGGLCTPPEFRCWDGSVVHAHPPDCIFPDCPPCPADSQACPDGITVVTRDPMNGCNFRPCGQRTCEGDTFTCPGGSGAVVGRDPSNFCEFEECPTTCPDDYRVCDDGSKVYRNPLNKCQFDLCGGRKHCPPDVYQCPNGMGYVFRDSEHNCEFFPCALATTPVGEEVAHDARTNDPARRAQIFKKIATSGTSGPEGMFALSPQSLALDWLASHDPLMLDTSNAYIMQRYALAVFYFSTFTYDELSRIHLGSNDQDLSHWNNEEGWLTGAGHCSWYGVQCLPRVAYTGDGEPLVYSTYDDTDSVTHLNLTSNGIRGVLPREFTALIDLRVLDLSDNVLAGPVPSRWAGMSNLTVLALQVNRLVGRMPLQLFNFRKLQVLNLEYNWLSGEIPDYWHMLDSLKQVRLGLNEFNGTVPVQFGALSNTLRVLWLDSNDMTGTVPYTLGYLEKLQTLFLHRNKLTGPIPEDLGRLEEVKELTLSENRLTGTIPSLLGRMSSLFSLYLEDNRLVGPIPTQLSKLRHLVVLRLFDNDISTPMPREICSKRENELDPLVWIAADCAIPHEEFGGREEVEVECDCCDECYGGLGDSGEQ